MGTAPITATTKKAQRRLTALVPLGYRLKTGSEDLRRHQWMRGTRERRGPRLFAHLCQHQRRALLRVSSRLHSATWRYEELHRCKWMFKQWTQLQPRLPKPSWGVTCAPVTKGHYLHSDKSTCLDIDECIERNGGCSNLCTNTIGGHFCSCPSGYELSQDERTCTDVNECKTGVSECEHDCINTPGLLEVRLPRWSHLGERLSQLCGRRRMQAK